MPKLLCIFLLFYAVNCCAQFNDSVYHYIKFSTGGTITHTQDNSSFLMTNSFNYSIKKQSIALNTSAGWIYGTQQGDVTYNDVTVHGDVNFFKPGKKLYHWALMNFDKSYSLNVLYRVQAGAGLAYDFIDSPNLRINVSDGFLYEQSDIKNDDSTHDVSSTPRNSFRLLYKWNIKDRFSITGVHFIQPSLKNINDYIFQSSTILSFKIKKWLSFNGNFTYNRVSATKRENLLITYTIVAEKYF